MRRGRNPHSAFRIRNDFIDNLREHIWARYGPEIQELCARGHITLHDNSQPDLFAPNDPFPF